ncbi:MAG: zinc ribbon domain-containing protein [Oscillospiraceae bacterium]|nr:zinc ribbon domain-containing protein [Oscillospiraceae bacterium]
MYCVKCGVKLQDGVSSCPLCGTPVWNPEQPVKEHTYPDYYPHAQKDSNRPFAIVMTVVCVMAIAVILTVCFSLYGTLNWGGYAIGGLLLFYVAVILPCWFRKPLVEVFVPVAHLAALLYTLFICLKTGGHWFMSFAFPVVLISCALFTAAACLIKHIRHGKFFIFGGFLLGLGGFTVLIEFFLHLTFQVPMFRWSLYSLIGFTVTGGFLLLAGMIPALRRTIGKHFFF